MINSFHINECCLACGENQLSSVLDLGMQPLANSYLTTADDDEPRYPLHMIRCNHCNHLQLSGSVDPQLLFANYAYVAGTSRTLTDYSRWFVEHVSQYSMRMHNRILDIGCNDGTQLNCFADAGWETYGVDPAENILRTTRIRHRVVQGFFPNVESEIFSLPYDIICAQNVLAHNHDPLSFLLACSNMMRQETLLFVQTSQADMVKNFEFDTIYHEHVNFFNTRSFMALCARAGLRLLSVSKTPIHGGSYLFQIAKLGLPDATVVCHLYDEQQLHSPVTYEVYADHVKTNAKTLFSTVSKYRHQGYKLVGYGAAAKGNTLLNYTGIDLDFIIDDSELKQGRFTPGRHIPIVARNYIQSFERAHIAWLPLAWNFHDEIVSKIKACRNTRDDVFIRYFPNVETIYV